MAFVVRTAVESDLESIARIHVRSWQTAFRGVVSDDFLDGMDTARSAAGWRKTFESFPDNLTVAETGGEIIGFCCAGPVVNREKNHPYAFEIYGIHVRPGCHRGGIGSQMLLTAFDRMRSLGLESAIVWTLEQLVQSRRFYEKHGGVLVKSAVWMVTGAPLNEVAYGWPPPALHS